MIILKSSSPLLALFRDNERVAKVVSHTNPSNFPLPLQSLRTFELMLTVFVFTEG